MILGPVAEQQLRRALAISQGDAMIFLTKPISAVVLGIAVLLLVVPPLWKSYAQRRVTSPAET
jgi:putative tricarboxylic transport membrane protein